MKIIFYSVSFSLLFGLCILAGIGASTLSEKPLKVDLKDTRVQSISLEDGYTYQDYEKKTCVYVSKVHGNLPISCKVIAGGREI